jgi:hypothetical protein
MATFGYTTHGANSTAFTAPQGSKFTAPGNGDITKITVWINAYYGGSVNFRVAIYSDSSGTPNAKLAESGSATAVSSSAEYDCNISYTMTGGTAYWLMAWADSANADTSWDTGTTHQGSATTAPTYPTWPGTWSETFALDRAYSFYATYTPAASGSPWYAYAQQ